MKALVLGLAGLSLSACITLKVTAVDRKSTLEEQFIGEFEELTDDLSTVASVRAEAHGLGLAGNDPYARALQARRLQKFYLDDLERARTRGCVGEALDGHIKELDCDKGHAQAGSQPAGAEPKIGRLVSIENQARTALVEYAVSNNLNLKESDKQLVWQAYRRIVLNQLKAGVMIENNAGQWVKK